MKFYLVPKAGNYPEELTSTEADCKAALKTRGLKGNPKDLVHEVPTDKPALMGYVNALLREIHQPIHIGIDQSTGPDMTAVVEMVGNQITRAEILEPEETSEEWFEHATLTFNPKLLELQVEKLGELGYTALDQLEGYQALHGVGGAFARGVILLCVLAAGEHQLARLFQHERSKK